MFTLTKVTWLVKKKKKDRKKKNLILKSCHEEGGDHKRPHGSKNVSQPGFGVFALLDAFQQKDT